MGFSKAHNDLNPFLQLGENDRLEGLYSAGTNTQNSAS